MNIYPIDSEYEKQSLIARLNFLLDEFAALENNHAYSSIYTFKVLKLFQQYMDSKNAKQNR